MTTENDRRDMQGAADRLVANREFIISLTDQIDEAKMKRTNLIVEGAAYGLDGDQLATATGLSRSAIHRHLARAGVSLTPDVPYTELEMTAIVTASAESLTDGRGSVNLESTPEEIAQRSLASWSLDKIRRERIPLRRLLVRLGSATDSPGTIVADWALDPSEPTRGDAFRPLNINDHNYLGTVGRRLSMQGEKLGQLVTWSPDIRALHASGESPFIEEATGESNDGAAQWKKNEGTGWIELEGFGAINPRRDNVGPAGRYYFTAKTLDGEYATAYGSEITAGPETWHYEVDSPFYLKDSAGHCIEVVVSLLAGGRYGVRYRDSVWPTDEAGAW
ncbi:hypothetical protein [Corynebacterium sp.]|uniref:hypothetical protein n=1 Tax=Corynebacterium sp. TaxID=1720 RepID=UPI0028AB799F|nr:hypothetical protein [Corynebacterium sp.]